MKPAYVFPIAAALSLALLGACSKPASQTAADASATTANAAQTAGDTAVNATDSAASASQPGGAVSPPQANDAVNTDANKNSSDLAAASNSFTEAQAKGHIENAGYTDVTNLAKTPDGLWTAKAKKDGKTMDVSVDFKGAVTAR